MNATLQVQDLLKRFTGLLVTDQVSLTLPEGELHALIGPNGAGKSTLINQLCGELASDAGRVVFLGEDITALPAYERSRGGLGRTFQISSLLDDFTVRRNVAMAVQARLGGCYRIHDRVEARQDVRLETDALLSGSTLEARRDLLASDLSSGERKQLELLMALAGKPRLLLLDEPMAGLGKVESQEMIKMLQSLRGKVTMLLIEHDMDAVFSLADRISVLVYGRIIMTGSVEDIRNSDEVRTAYLGEEDELC